MNCEQKSLKMKVWITLKNAFHATISPKRKEKPVMCCKMVNQFGWKIKRVGVSASAAILRAFSRPLPASAQSIIRSQVITRNESLL